MNKPIRWFYKQVATALMLLAFLTALIAPLKVAALDAQVLPIETQARTGFTHAISLFGSDLTNTLTHSLYRLIPRSGNGAAGDVIDRVGVYIVQPFYVTNANAGSNSVFLNAGSSIVTNAFLSNFPIGSNQTQLAFVTNLTVPIILSAATNFTVASITTSNASMTTNMLINTTPEVQIWIRVTPFARLSNW